MSSRTRLVCPGISIDAQTAEDRYRLEPRDERTPETLYDYRWAMALLDQVLSRLQQEFSEAGKDELFTRLRSYMVEGATELSYPEGARQLGMTEEALRKLESAVVWTTTPGQGLTVALSGHADALGRESYNDRLGSARAETVKRYLMEKLGLSADSIRVVSYGEKQPVAPNKTRARLRI